MSTFDNEYYFIRRPGDDRIPFLGPDKDTLAKNYQSEVQPFGMKPFVFHNAMLEDQLKNKIRPIGPPSKILFDGADLLLLEKVLMKTKQNGLPMPCLRLSAR